MTTEQVDNDPYAVGTYVSETSHYLPAGQYIRDGIAEFSATEIRSTESLELPKICIATGSVQNLQARDRNLDVITKKGMFMAGTAGALTIVGAILLMVRENVSLVLPAILTLPLIAMIVRLMMRRDIISIRVIWYISELHSHERRKIMRRLAALVILVLVVLNLSFIFIGDDFDGGMFILLCLAPALLLISGEDEIKVKSYNQGVFVLTGHSEAFAIVWAATAKAREAAETSAAEVSDRQLSEGLESS